jgi:hypothetical protein
MHCEDRSVRITELMEGELDVDDEAAALQHLASCDRFEAVLAETRDVVQVASKHGRITLDQPTRTGYFQGIADSHSD